MGLKHETTLEINSLKISEVVKRENVKKVINDIDDNNSTTIPLRNNTHNGKIKKLIDNIKMNQEKQNSVNNDQNLKSSNLDSLKDTGSCFRHRFKAQKDLLENQKIKLQEQEKIINELKIGILTNDVKDYLDKSKNEIRELFSDCTSKLIGKVSLEYAPMRKSEKLVVITGGAPKIVQELEKRALKRMEYREMIKERKKILEEKKRIMQEVAIEKKRCLEEDEKIKQLERIKETRREEFERMKIRQINKENFIKNLNKSIEFHQRKILKNAFYRWLSYYKYTLDKEVTSQNHYKTNILKTSFKKLFILKEQRNFKNNKLVEKFYSKMVLKKGFEALKENRMNGIRSKQVAEDYYDFSIQRKSISCLKKFRRKEKIIADIKIQQALLHYQKKLLFQSFFKWQSLPTIIKLEKSKEERKQKWRQKVLEVLPDFNPSEIF